MGWGDVLVECFGVPGAGKTLVAANVARALRRRRALVHDEALQVAGRARPIRILIKLWYVMRTPSLCSLMRFSHALRDARSTGGMVFGSDLKVLWNWVYLVARLRLQLHREGITLLDQGLFQALWSTFYHSEGNPPAAPALGRVLSEALEMLDRPCIIVIVVEVKEPQVRRRLRTRARGQSPLDHLDVSPAAWVKAREGTTRVLDVIDGLASGSDWLKVVRFDNSLERSTEEEFEQRVADQILPIVLGSQA